MFIIKTNIASHIVALSPYLHSVSLNKIGLEHLVTDPQANTEIKEKILVITMIWEFDIVVDDVKTDAYIVMFPLAAHNLF